MDKNINNLKNIVSNIKDNKKFNNNEKESSNEKNSDNDYKNKNINILNKKIDYGKLILNTDNNYYTNYKDNDNDDYGKNILNTDNNNQNDNFKFKTLKSDRNLNNLNLKPSLSNSNIFFRNSASQRNIFNDNLRYNNTVSSKKDIFFNNNPAISIKKNPQMEKLIKSICEDKNVKIKISNKVCNAMLMVDRNDFIPPYSQNLYKSKPYENRPQLINEKLNVRISAPHMHLYALSYLENYLKNGCHVLDIGCGTGYL